MASRYRSFCQKRGTEMKFGRRSKRSVSKAPILGQLLSGLNRRERRALAKQNKAMKSPAKPRRPAFGLEPVEPRLLMSVDLSYTQLNDTVTLSAGMASGTPFVNLGDAGGTLVQKNLVAPGDFALDISNTIGAGSSDNLHIDLTSFAQLATFVTGNGGTLDVTFDGGGEGFGTTNIFADHLFVDGNSGTLGYGLSIQSTSDIASSATIDATSLSLTSKTTEGGTADTGLFADAKTAVSLTGAHITTSGALSLTADSELNVSSNGFSLSQVSGNLFTSFSSSKIDVMGGSMLTSTGGDITLTSQVNGSLIAALDSSVATIGVIAGSPPAANTIDKPDHHAPGRAGV